MSDNKRLIIIDYNTNKEIEYDSVYLHSKPEEGILSIYNGGLGDRFRTLYVIKSKQLIQGTDKIRLEVIKFWVQLLGDSLYG